ncbi:MAG: 50S ribosomal protein L28 [Gemmatimonadetes bacterium]|nr:50S ribosomal protein L28 [Gemmatimonadota bacterium]
MAKCAFCQKGPRFGHHRSHSMRATRKVWRPNIFQRSLVIDGERRRVYVCARCLRTMTKHMA